MGIIMIVVVHITNTNSPPTIIPVFSTYLFKLSLLPAALITFFTTVANTQANNKINPAFKIFKKAPVKPEYIETNGVAIEFKFKILKNKTNANNKTIIKTTFKGFAP